MKSFKDSLKSLKKALVSTFDSFKTLKKVSGNSESPKILQITVKALRNIQKLIVYCVRNLK